MHTVPAQWKAFAMGVLLALAVAGVLRAGDAKEEVITAWKKRERDTRTVSAIIEEQRHFPKGGPAGLEEGDPPLAPPLDADKSFVRTVVLDGERMLHCSAGDTWVGTARSFLPEKMISVTDGKIARSLHFHEERTDEVHSLGFIHQTAAHPDRSNAFLAPVLKHFRPFSPELGSYQVDKWTVIGTDAAVGDAPCILIREGKPDDPNSKEFWIDPKKGMSVVLFHYLFQGRLSKSIDIRLKQDARLGWICDTWTVTTHWRDKAATADSGKLIELKLNEPVPDRTFALEFPPGTVVSDYAARRMSLIRDDGTFYLIPPEDSRNTYSQWVKQSRDSAFRRPSPEP